ncbi:MAG: hypothetical protein WC724_03820, partial [Candidatus Paceibacterota bacterium]
QVKIRVLSRTDFLNHLKVCFGQLWVLSETPFEILNVPLSQEEKVQILKHAFKGNEKTLKLLRKIFYPEIDITASLEEVIDLYSIIDVANMTPEEVWIKMSARNEVISYVEGSLKAINLLAEAPEEKTSEEKEKVMKINSSK